MYSFPIYIPFQDMCPGPGSCIVIEFLFSAISPVMLLLFACLTENYYKQIRKVEVIYFSFYSPQIYTRCALNSNNRLKSIHICGSNANNILLFSTILIFLKIKSQKFGSW